MNFVLRTMCRDKSKLSSAMHPVRRLLCGAGRWLALNPAFFICFAGEGLGKIGKHAVCHLRTLGAGSFGQVELVQFTKTGVKGAMKKTDKDFHHQWENEILCTNRVHEMKTAAGSDFVVKVLDSGREEYCDVIVLEYCQGGDLFEKFGGPLKETHARFYLAQLGK